MMTNQTKKQAEKVAPIQKLKVYNLIILDKSGSMGSIADAAVSGFNETVGGIRSAQKQYVETQEHYVSLYVFCACDRHYLYENVPVEDVPILTRKEYVPCCCTPLYDAMGASLNKLFSQISSDDNATAVVTVITDGLENASKEFSGSTVKVLVDKLKDEEGWNFAYIGTNHDVTQVAQSLSIENTLHFCDDSEGMASAWRKERKSKARMFDHWNEIVMCCEPFSPGERKAMMAETNRTEKNYVSLEEFADRQTPDNIRSLKANEVFVFGSNLEGMHGGGAARIAYEKFGAVMGQGVGMQGQSYGIPTMQGGVDTILPYVDEFIQYAQLHPEKTFLVTRIGCGIAGFTDQEIAPLFISAIRVPNIHLPETFWNELV